MPKNVIITDANDLANVALPNHGKRYTVVSHKFIIDETLAQLAANGFIIDKEEYCRNLNGEVALGVYHLKYGNDPDMGLMFTWANSYDKTMRFRCAIGAHTYVSEARLIAGDMSNYGRVHTGDAKQQVQDHIKTQIQGANSYFASLVKDKDKMKEITLSETQVAELMGVLYFQENVLTSSQLINVKEEYKKPSYTYSTPEDSLWSIYNHIIVGLKKAHPKTWMEQQKNLHALVDSRYLMNAVISNSVPEVDPNQTSLIDQIEEIEGNKTTDVEVVSETNAPKEEPEVLSLDSYFEESTTTESTAPDLLGSIDPDLNTSDTEDESSDIVFPSDPEGVTIEDEVQIDNEPISDFPTPPSDLPVYSEDQVTADIPCETAEELLGTEEPCEEEEDVFKSVQPLEEQVATEYVAPVSEAEQAVSAPPVVDEPIVVDNDAVNFDPQPIVETDAEYAERVASIEGEPEEDPELEYLKEGPIQDDVFTPEPEAKNTLTEDFNFDF